MENKIEILAPAGSWDSLTAAAVCGADAVYLGGKTLNARRNAGNFTDEDLGKAVGYCHVRGVKVYQTLNTVLFDDEIPELLSAARRAAEIGVDAVIVQDLGVLRLLRQAAPDLPLAASTQMAVHNVSGALEAESLGCSIVVLARELTAREIGAVTRALTAAKTEVFIHGALCMSVSGQCYLSAMLGGRSGNRGLCAQPCRLPFAAGRTTHALSLKDLSMVGRLEELKRLGVSSVKIEGRMKRPEYVAAAVTAVREARDGGAPDLTALRSVFSRSGFTSGYFDGKRDRSMFGVRTKEDVTAASDVLGQLARLAVKEQPRVPLTGAFTAEKDAPARLTVSDGQGHTAEISGDPPQTALTSPTDAGRVRRSLEKTGGTPFYWEALEVSVGEGLMIPAAQCNAMRRQALEAMDRQRGTPVPWAYREVSLPEIPPAPRGKAILRARVSGEQISSALIGAVEELCVPFSALKTALEAGVPGDRLLLEIPRILFTGEDVLKKQLAEAKALGVVRAWCGNLGAVRLAREAGMEICGGWSLNLTNTLALEQIRDMGAASAEVSFEISADRMGRLGNVLPLGALAYGCLPLMVYRNCPMKAAVGCERCRGNGVLTDRTGRAFRLSCRDGVTELFNSVPLYLADRKDKLPGAFYTLWFTNESAARCARIAAEYAGLSPAVPPKDLTRGLYYRSVL